MIPAISPEVFRGPNENRMRKWYVSVALYGCAAMLSSALVGSVTGLLGSWLPWRQSRAIPLVLAALTALYGMHELGVIRMPHPQLRRQAPSGWRNLHPWMTALSFGGYLGLGLLHFTYTTAFLVALVWCLLTGDPSRAAATMAAFGLGLTLPIVLVSRQVMSPDHAYEIGCAINDWGPAVRIVNGIVMIALAILAALAFWWGQA